MENIQNFPQTATQDIPLQPQRVLRNTYALLALSMVPTVMGALAGIQAEQPFRHHLQPAPQAGGDGVGAARVADLAPQPGRGPARSAGGSGLCFGP